MNIMLIILSLLAVLAAIESVLRVRDKFVFNYTQRPARVSSLDESETFSRAKLHLEPDQDSIESVNPISGMSEARISVPNASGSESALDSVSSESLPLATSLTVSELLSSSEVENHTASGLYPGPSLEHPLKTGEQTQAHSAASVLEEIAQLEHVESKERIAQLAKLIDHKID